MTQREKETATAMQELAADAFLEAEWLREHHRPGDRYAFNYYADRQAVYSYAARGIMGVGV